MPSDFTSVQRWSSALRRVASSLSRAMKRILFSEPSTTVTEGSRQLVTSRVLPPQETKRVRKEAAMSMFFMFGKDRV